MRVAILGISGMIGSAVFREFSSRRSFSTFGMARSPHVQGLFRPHPDSQIITGFNIENFDAVTAMLDDIRPDVVINCIGVVKQLPAAADPLLLVPANSIFPHRLARLCALSSTRLIHISTDCVFGGARGNYRETDATDADDLYGRSKILGEVDYPHAITLRTSAIGREIAGHHGLLDWYLNERGPVRGFAGAVFSGLTTNELAGVLADHVIPHPHMRGIYHLGGEPIAKLDLLNIVKSAYRHTAEIEPDTSVAIDRSLDSSRFRALTGYRPPSWPDMIERMAEREHELAGA